MNGFAIGPSTNPCTKGLWLWGEPLRYNDDTDVLIIDTEGLNSVCKILYIYVNMYVCVERDKNIDMKIFSISVLLASMLIYNS